MNTAPTTVTGAWYTSETFRANYRQLVGTIKGFGATDDEADEAIAEALKEVVERGRQIRKPWAYVRTAAVTNFVKAKTRGPERLRDRLLERHGVPAGSGADERLAEVEDWLYIARVLHPLPPAEREAMVLRVAGLTPTDIAERLGKTPEAVRRNLHTARQRLVHQLARNSGTGHPTAPAPNTAREEAP